MVLFNTVWYAAPVTTLSPRLPLLLALADAAHDGEAVLLSVGGLRSALGIRLALQNNNNNNNNNNNTNTNTNTNTTNINTNTNK